MTASSVAVIVLRVLAGLTLILLSVLGLFRLLVSMSGWYALAARYRTDGRPDGESLHRQSLMVGKVRFRRCATVVTAAEGLYLAIPLGETGLLIPWAELKPLRRRRAHGRAAVQLQIGEPQVGILTVAPALFARIEPHVGPPPP